MPPMKWSELPFHPRDRTLRQFAVGWLVVFTLLGLSQYHWHHRTQLGWWLIGLALALGVPGLFFPKLLRPIFVGWMILAFPIGWAVSLLLLLLLYFVIFTPIGWLLRLRGRDMLGRKSAAGAVTFWTPKHSVFDVTRYFRQY